MSVFVQNNVDIGSGGAWSQTKGGQLSYNSE
jgi:hypothetical protein